MITDAFDLMNELCAAYEAGKLDPMIAEADAAYERGVAVDSNAIYGNPAPSKREAE